MKIYLITEFALCKKHGTGSQLLRLFEGLPFQICHIYFYEYNYGNSEYACSFFLSERPLKFYRGAGFVSRMRVKLKLVWWSDNAINKEKFRGLRNKHNMQGDLAYVVVGSEDSAQRAVSILKELKCPYVVHIMDLYHDFLDPSTMPGFAELLQNTEASIALTKTIRDEISKFSQKPIYDIPIGQEISSNLAQPPALKTRLRIVTVGKPYQLGFELLAKSWSLLTCNREIELVYAGAWFKDLPDEIRNIATDLGHIEDKEQYSSLLASCHLGFLSGPSSLDCYGRFSFPSRCADYFMAGLPIIGCIAKGSATEAVLSPLVPHCATIIHTPEEIKTAVDFYTNDIDQWVKSSRRAREYALSSFNIADVRQQVANVISELIPIKG